MTFNLRLTAEAKAEWERLASENGVTASALAEATGLLVFAEGKTLEDAIAYAREVTAERKRRKEP